MEFNTIEDARAEIVRLNDVVTELTNERDTLSQNYADQSAELENVRRLNQQYFNRLTAQKDEVDEPDEPDVPTCEEFAATLNII